MMSYFKPLRRKIGVVILVLACAFAGGWVRSRFGIDHVWLCGNGVVCWFLSGGSSLRLMTQIRPQAFVPPEFPEPALNFSSLRMNQLRDGTVNSRFEIDTSKEIESRWPFERVTYWKRMGFEFGEYSETDSPNAGIHYFMVSAPYWSIVLPLSLLSAWLLFSNPRAGKTPVQPVPTE